ncbi:hypothetical protein FDI61_gp008 [Mycobacterium phage Marvin]|uniref:Uncharacterized protein n=3 Tax=Caudoviricetes TaxID=2731619 RepID=A0A3G8FJZ9_9CAUD|nr:hypothetical protein FDI61_gp008 [Mycobacterium phage Marvin]YP_009636253.1 hypothetical protein FGG20_gp082 [Mycobacterium phage Baka]YP_009963579.1 hypothetical protein I5I00_gp082 [Mycobacterium phage Zerg]QQM15383.1 hypothetical protein SEA_POUND_77 [Mycobacterium phage Pound]AEJ95292.1 hypothetical protein MARVIN_8 [Mycobacterium phage Marvin]AEK08139.1 hypothetical protein PBI_BAKA_82 [Mycobacterium phage Baka]AZF95148.1 hypothetical protein ZERG_82 [Mycobacterium phage Zerg]
MSGDAQKIMSAVQRRHRRTLNLETGRSHCQGTRVGECDFRDGSLDDFEAHVAAEIDRALGGLRRETRVIESIFELGVPEPATRFVTHWMEIPDE